MIRLTTAAAAIGFAALLAMPAQAETQSKPDGLRTMEQTEFSSHRRRWHGHRHWRHRHYGYYGPRYYRPHAYYPYYGPRVGLSFGFGPRYGWW